jgi:hypothetical protein
VRLQTYAHFADRDPLTKAVLERMLAGVSTRRYRRTAEPVGSEVAAKERSTSRSSVSRNFIERTRVSLSELMSRRLDDVRLAVMIKPLERRLLQRLTPGKPASYSFTIPARDEHGFAALAELRHKGINLVASALAQSTDHILSFFSALRAELGFYVACLNLHEQLVEKGEPTCFPIPLAAGRPALSTQGLYDVSLAFHLDSNVVGNTVNADGKALVMITGANQGGKSTFLRSVGLAQLMMQAGMFVGAESFTANVCEYERARGV